MKIVHISPHADGTGYSKAAIENILALDAAGVEVVPRSLKMTNTTGEIPKRIKELEQNDLNNVDVVYQYNLPDQFIYKGGVKNVGGFAYETSGYLNNNWIDHLKLMDQVIIPCEHQKGILTKNILEKTSVVPHSVDVNKFSQEYPIIDFDLPKDTVKFYTIAEFGRRKNIPALLLSYYSRFSVDDNVVLILKTHMPNRDRVTASETIRGLCDDLKKGLNRFSSLERYPKVILQTGYMTDDEINSLHKSCDIFVTASHGEAWCLPAIDALGFGNPILAPDYGAFKDYIKKYHGFLVSGVKSPVFGVIGAPLGLYTSDETWFNINIEHLALSMEMFYKNIEGVKKFKDERISHVVDNYSRIKVGNLLKTALEK